MKKLLLISCFFLSIAGQAGAQSLSPAVIASSGGFSTGTGVLLSSTVAEMTMVNTFSSGTGILTQGFQQPEDFNVGITALLPGNNSLQVYPNPANDAFSIQSLFAEEGTLFLTLVDAIGQLVMPVASVETIAGVGKYTMNSSSLAPGIYLLTVYFISSSRNNQRFLQQIAIHK